MHKSKYYRPPFKLLTPGNSILLTLTAAGLGAAFYRFILGLGATTNLSNQYPWGIWVAFDVVCGVALAAGGFTTAAVVDIFCDKRYHGLLRPAILTGFLGYVFVALGLIVDLGLPWHIYHPIIYWPKHSALFEVAWCVMLYLSVLALEFIPAVIERLNWEKIMPLYRRLTRIYVVVALSWFTYIMSHSLTWAAVAFVVLAALAIALPHFIARETGVPIILIMAGILFSTAHQSSLGTLFLLMPDKLHELWWTPMLPILFFVSAVAVGFAMVIFESTLSSKLLGQPVESEALAGMSRILVYILAVNLLLRIGDVLARGATVRIMSAMGALFIVEMLISLVLPLIVLAAPRWRTDTWWRFGAATAVVAGLIMNRFNVTIFAMERPGDGFYFPSIEELLVSIGLMAGLVFLYSLMVRFFPVLPAMEKERIKPELLDNQTVAG